MTKVWTQAFRSLIRRPGFTVAAILILATGIAANTTVFSIVDAVLLKPLPYPNPDRVVTVFEANSSRSEKQSLIAPSRLEDWNRMNRTFDVVAGSYAENVTDTSGDEPQRLAARRVSPHYFDVFGSRPVAGRTFTSDEDRNGGPTSAVISYNLWTRRYRQSPDVIGRRLIFKGQSFTIVGVMPLEFAAPVIDLWLPAQLAPFLMQLRDARFYTGVGRMKPGVTITQAQEDLARVQRELGQQFPQTDKDWSALVGDFKEARIGEYRHTLIFVFAAVGLLLLIAVANIASLMLAELHHRQRELAIRNSIGATRTQVIATVMREVLLIAMAGVALGCALDAWSLRILGRILTALPHSAEFQLDWRTLLFASIAGLAAAMVSGFLPALLATRTDLASVLAQAGRGIAGHGRRWQQILVTGQIALAILLLSSTGLMMRSYYNLSHVDLGFEPSHEMTFHVSAAWDEDRNRIAQIQKDLLEKLSALPGVAAAGFANFLPASDATLRYQIQLDEIAQSQGTGRITVGERGIGGDYLKALGAPLMAGQSCPAFKETSGTPPKAIVNRRFTELYGQGENLVGRHFHWTENAANTPATEIVGVVGDIREDNFRSSPTPYVYSCMIPGGWPDPEYVVRTQGDPRPVEQELRALIHDVDSSRAVFGMQTLQDELDSTLDQTRLQTELIAIFGFAAVALASVGLYSLVSLIVTGRRREIGIRLALGAKPRRVVADVIAGVARLLLAGMAIGLVLMFAAVRLLRSEVFGVQPLDALTLGAAILTLVFTSAAATFLPARRAAKVDPLAAIREV